MSWSHTAMRGFDRTRPSGGAFENDHPAEDIDAGWNDADAAALLDEAEAEKSSTPMEDSVQLYLREIGQVSLLSAADEVALAQDIVRGREARLLLQWPNQWSWNERIALERDVALGDEARRR